MVAAKAIRLLARGLWLGLIMFALGAFICVTLIAVAGSEAMAAVTTWALKRAA